MLTIITKYKDVITVGFSVLSLIIACVSLFFSGRTAWYDRARLKISGRVIYEANKDRAHKIEVVVLNIGRRDAVLEGILLHYENDNNSYSYEKEGVIVKEKQRRKFDVLYQDLIFTGREGDVYSLEDISILDVEGEEHKIPNSRYLVSKFHKDWNNQK